MIYLYFFTFIFFCFIVYNYVIQTKFNSNFPKIWLNKYFYFKYLLLLISFFYLWISYFTVINQNQSSNEYLFSLDLSKSMLVNDVKDWDKTISRLEASKKIISQIVSKTNWKYSLIVFTSDSLWILPFIWDKDLFLTFLEWLDYNNLPKQWTDYNKMLKWISERIIDDETKNIIILTDGWDSWDINENLFISTFNNELADFNNNYEIIWIWSLDWWKIITWVDVFWEQVYKKHNWEDLILKLNNNNIDFIHKILGGKKYIIDNLNQIDNILKENKDLVFEIFSNVNYLNLKSFVFFILFLFLFLFEEKIYSLIFKNDKKSSN